MQKLLWAERQKLRRSNIIWIAVFAAVLVAVIVFIGGESLDSGVQNIDDVGWYMTTVQPWATFLVLPAVISLLGSYMICREEQEDTLKTLRLIPVSEDKLTAAKMIITFACSVLIYLLIFAITCLTELVLHFSDLSVILVLDFLKMYVVEGVGVFFAISPIIALVSYMKQSYWLALVLAEMYSFAGIFMSMSNTLKTFYPITAVFGIAGYYETTVENRIGSAISLLLCGCLSAFILNGLNHTKKGSGNS
ncbi:ABC transporter permease [Anaerosporobacter sp.]